MKNKKLKINDLILAISLNILFFLLIINIFGIHYETNDDYGMAAITAGANGTPVSKLIFINVILGKILKLLTIQFPIINWYTLFQILTVFASLLSLTYIFLKNNKKIISIVISILIAYFGFDCYVNMQFTKTAGIATISGCILIAYALQERRIRAYFIGASLLIIGSLYRFDACGMALIILSFLGIEHLIKLIQQRESKEIIFYIIKWCIPLILIIGFKIIDTTAYNSDESWKNYREYNTLRAELLDHGFPDYDKNEALYTSLNISREDLNMFKGWNFADPDIFNTDSMQALVNAKEKKCLNLNTIKSFITEAGKLIIKEPAFNAVIIALLVLLCIGCCPFKTLLWNAIVYIGIEFYLFFYDRYMLHRIEIVLWLSILCILLYYSDNRFNGLNLKYNILIATFLLVLNTSVYIQTLENKSDFISYRNVVETISNDPEHLYIIPTLSDPVSLSYDAFDVIPYGIRKNIAYLGGWGTEFPTENMVLYRYGIRNPFRDIIDNDYVYLASYGNIEEILNYIRRHYNENIQAQTINEFNGMIFYKIVSE